MTLTKQNLRYIIKKVNQDIEDFNSGKTNLSKEALTELYMLKEEIKAELARVLIKG